MHGNAYLKARVPMVSCQLIERCYECAHIRRWNDHIRPVEFTELDKQAHKMIIAYVLARFEEEGEAQDVDWIRLIEGGIFEFLHRIILTDIKPPVFHKMMREKGRELNEWVLEKLDDEISQVSGGFSERFKQYLFDPQYAHREKRVLKAAHYLATQWEFNIIYKLCPFAYGIERTKEEIETLIEDHYELTGVQRVSLSRKVAGFVNVCGQLRFQRRWSQSPRIPETSVLGHMLMVAITTYLCLRDIDASDQRVCNGFLGGLFHDLPEVLTRDITSPVKNAVAGLDSIIKDYEKQQMEERLLPLLPESWHQEIRYYTENEFSNRAIVDGQVKLGLTADELKSTYSEARFSPLDGEVIRACDHLAALIEASLSIGHGVTSKHLTEGRDRLLSQYENQNISGIDFGHLFASFA